MPIRHAIWKVEANPAALSTGILASEQSLEEMILKAPEILSADWMIIGRQENTAWGGRIDLLAIAPDASLVLIELKRNRTPREIVAQAIDYAAWVETLTADKISQIYQRFSTDKSLDDAFATRFGVPLEEEALNASHQIILVAAELDDASERIINYLNARDIAINVLFFQVFQFGTDQLLSRAWLIDPGETQDNVAAASRSKDTLWEPWNGEFYASFSNDRPWDEARKFGFISAGGGRWYSRTLKLLSPGDRIWVNVPQIGYVGVGRVLEPAQSVEEFCQTASSIDDQLASVLKSLMARKHVTDLDRMEYIVRIKWLNTLPKAEAFNEVGLFGNQNTICKPTTPKWRHTIERLKTAFGQWDIS